MFLWKATIATTNISFELKVKHKDAENTTINVYWNWTLFYLKEMILFGNLHLVVAIKKQPNKSLKPKSYEIFNEKIPWYLMPLYVNNPTN
jgi:hypothetical protein